METPLADACPLCGGQKKPSQLDRLGLEPSSLERETPHRPDCPKLRIKKPLRALVPALSLALLPVVGAGGCHDSDQEMGVTPSPTGGLDSGTIGMVDDLIPDGLIPKDETAS